MHFLKILLFSLFFVSAAFATEAPPVNINTADVETLMQGLKGIGKSKAEAIIKYRETYGNFEAVDELEAVKGIGPAIVSSNRDHIVLK